jgi:hypothetical protein
MAAVGKIVPSRPNMPRKQSSAITASVAME